jgi:hypothetical protein
VASDSTGIHLVALTGLSGVNPNGDVWTSADAGATWTNRTKGTQASGQRWESVASDATGIHLVAVSGDPAPPAGLQVSMPCCFGDIWSN